MGDGNRAALSLIALQGINGPTLPNVAQFFAQVEGIVDAPIHAHAAAGAVEVGGVTDQHHPAHHILLHHPLVDAVGAHLQHRVVQGARGNAQQFFAHRWHAHRLFHALPFIGVQADAPQVLEPQQAEGALLAPAIVDVGQIGQVIVKRKVRGRQDGGLGKGMAFKRQIQLFAHLAAPAIGPHQKSPAHNHLFASRCAVSHIDMALGLAERHQRVIHQHLHMGQVARNLRHQ